MNAKRRQKLQALARELPLPDVFGAPEGDVLLVGWGSTQGPIREAVLRARREGQSLSSLNLRHIFPLPEGLETVFGRFRHIYVVEMNDAGLYGYGQLAALLRARFVDGRIVGINKTDGLTWKVREILDQVRDRLAGGARNNGHRDRAPSRPDPNRFPMSQPAPFQISPAHLDGSRLRSPTATGSR